MHALSPRRFQGWTLFGLFVGLIALSGASGCATTPSTPLSRDALMGSKWKMVMAGGRMDHRVVQFDKKDNRLIGALIDKGRVLSQIVGVNEGMEMFSISPAPGEAQNIYTGMYRSVTNDGRPQENEVIIEFFEDHFTWNLESAVWSRVE